jgi:hypothetical protein
MHSIKVSYFLSISIRFNKSLNLVRDQEVGGFQNPLYLSMKARVYRPANLCNSVSFLSRSLYRRGWSRRNDSSFSLNSEMGQSSPVTLNASSARKFPGASTLRRSGAEDVD